MDPSGSELSSYGNYSSVADNARTVPYSPKDQVSAFGRISSLTANARAVPSAALTQVRSYRTISAVTACARDVPQVPSPVNRLSTSKDDKAHQVSSSHDSSLSTCEAVLVMIQNCESATNTEEPLPIEKYGPGHTSMCDASRGLSLNSVATPNNIEIETTANSNETGNYHIDVIVSVFPSASYLLVLD